MLEVVATCQDQNHTSDIGWHCLLWVADKLSPLCGCCVMKGNFSVAPICYLYHIGEWTGDALRVGLLCRVLCGNCARFVASFCVWIYASLRSTLSSMRLGTEFDISCCFSSWTIGVDLNVSTCFSSYSWFSRDSRVHFLYNACTSRRFFFWVWGGRCVFWIYVKTW